MGRDKALAVIASWLYNALQVGWVSEGVSASSTGLQSRG